MSLSSSAHTHAVTEPRLDIAQTLKPAVRAIGLSRIVRGAVLGFALGAFLGAGVLLAGHVWSLGSTVLTAVLLVAAGVVAGAAWGIMHWPGEQEAARAADLYFGLDDRLTTAVELRGSDTPVAHVQSRDTAQHVEGLPLARSRGRWLLRRDAALALVAALALTAGLALGSPAAGRQSTLTAAGKVNSQRVQRAAAKKIRKIQAHIQAGLTPAQQQTPAVRKLNRALARLRRQLLKAGSTPAQLRAISATQQKLHSLATSLHPINSHAVAQLNGSLSHQLGKRPGAGKHGSTSRSAAATAQALSRLAQSLSHLNAAQRAALARALARAANSNSNPGLRSQLRQAAFQLANNHPQAAQSALQKAARQLSQSAANQAAQSQALSTATQLSSLKQSLSNASSNGNQQAGQPGQQASNLGKNGSGSRSTGSNGGQKGAQGQALGQGRGKGTGKGQALGQGRGTRAGGTGRKGIGSGSRSAQGRGQGTGAAQGRNGTGSRTGRAGAHGSGGQGRSAATRAGRTALVYVPGKQGKGQQVIKNGPNGLPQIGSLVPYQQVFGKYSQQAHQALDRGSLPPSVQSYVHRYFSSISH